MTRIDVMEKRSTGSGPFLGGWRSKATGIVYYNACTQTGRNGQDTRERTAQTEPSVDKFTDMQRDASLQVNFLPDVRDRLLEADGRSRKSSRQDHHPDERILKSVVKIQRFYRAHRGRKTEQLPLSGENRDERRVHVEQPTAARDQEFAILDHEKPRTRTDFELLYNLLDRWRIRETERIGQLLFRPSRIAFGDLILTKEVELLRGIDALKTSAKLDRRRRTCRKFLDELSKPVVWRTSRDQPILVDTPRVQRARRFRDAFDELSEEDVSVEERVKLLSRLRNELEPHTCKVSDELIRLLGQELDLLRMNVDPSQLIWLRGRQKLAFLELAKNSLSDDSSRVNGHLDDGRRSIRKEICKSCNRLLPAEKFPRTRRSRVTSCEHCRYARARTGPRVVYEQYRSLLRDVRRQEARSGCYTSPAFVVDEKLVYRLVNDVWLGKSAISEVDSLDRLRLTRFRRDVEWSPWNCVLLTVEEASLHQQVNDPEKFYSPTLLQKFHTRNLQAKLLFRSVLEFESGRIGI